MQSTASRRQAIVLLSAGTALAHGETAKKGIRIHQEVDFAAPPARIYQILLDAREFSAFTGHPAEIQPQAGGTLKMFGGLIEGRNIETVPNQRLVQAWREASWKPGYFSLVKFELAPRAGGSHLVFDQTGIAEDDFGHLNEGWRIRYWEPLRKYLKT